MVVFLSVPMNGKTNEEIHEEFKKAKNYIANKYNGEPIEFLDSFIENAPDKPLKCLGKSLEILSEADAIYFFDGWENARGCRIEFEAAVAYGLRIIR